MNRGELWIDATAIFAVARTSGIQRVVRTALEAAPEGSVVVFDGRSRCYRQAKIFGLGESKTAGPSPKKKARIFLEFLRAIWLVLSPSLYRVLGKGLYTALRNFGIRAIFNRLSADRVPEPALSKPVELDGNRRVLLLDIPKTEDHFSFLERISSRGEIALDAYLYDVIPFDFPELLDGPDSKQKHADFLRYLRIISRAQNVTCLSDYTANRFNNYLDKQDLVRRPTIRRLYPPIDAAYLEPNSSTTKKSQGPSEEVIQVFAIGPLTKRKNHAVLLRALLLAKHQGINMALTLVLSAQGSIDMPTLRNLIWAKLTAGKQLHIYGPVTNEELNVLYSKATVVAVPSVVEGYGLPIIEGLTRRTPVVTSQGSSFDELAKVLPILTAPATEEAVWLKQILHAREANMNQVPIERITTTKSAFQIGLLGGGDI